MDDIGQALQRVRDVFVNYPKRFEENEEGLKRCDQETQDLLHVIEFSNFSASEGYRLARELQEVRRLRREIKNEQEVLQPIVKDFLKYGKITDKNISKTIGDIRSIESKQERRTYTMRVRTDLQEKVSNK